MQTNNRFVRCGRDDGEVKDAAQIRASMLHQLFLQRDAQLPKKRNLTSHVCNEIGPAHCARRCGLIGADPLRTVLLRELDAAEAEQRFDPLARRPVPKELEELW